MLGECDSCHFETALTAFDTPPMASWDGKKNLCKLCSSTLTSNALDYPSQYRRDGRVMQTVCYVGNAILAELRRER